MNIINWQLAKNPVNYLIVLIMVVIGAFLVDGLLKISARAGALPLTTMQVQAKQGS